MKSIITLIRETLKIFVIFVACTLLFYFGLRAMHAEYENYHRYDPPEGRAIKVFNNNEGQDIIDRMSIFFRLGE
ncbi:YqzK family protein [Radiobacillus sp. PE A8.2]|uniref:YqzK family protein n=1 Tax=Radiobacillus sp. PE A8.2 TaxID=3380349 RepID=UPI00388F32EE